MTIQMTSSHDYHAPAEGRLARVLEPELMEDTARAEAYAASDFSRSDGCFVARFSQVYGGGFRGRAVDLGCGPGNIAFRFASRFSQSWMDAWDGALPMLKIAERRKAQVGALGDRLRLRQVYLGFDCLPEVGFDAVLSNSLLHHLPDPMVLWATVARLGRPGAAILVGDLRRPETGRAHRDLVRLHGAGLPPLTRVDLDHSLGAAFTAEEIGGQLRRAGLSSLTVEPVGDRHVVVYGRLPVLRRRRRAARLTPAP